MGSGFRLDGFGAPVYAEAIAAAASPDVTSTLLTSFAAEAIKMSRFGLVSWVAGGIGMMILGALLLYPGKRRGWRVAVGVSGMLIGAGPLVANIQGEYAGSPFVSRFWMANALVVGLWYMALASCAFGHGPSRTVTRAVKIVLRDIEALRAETLKRLRSRFASDLKRVTAATRHQL